MGCVEEYWFRFLISKDTHMKKYILYSLVLFACDYKCLSAASQGTLDPSFNADGTLPGTPGVETIPLSDFDTDAMDAAAYVLQIQSNGLIVAAGLVSLSTANSMVIARLLPSGAFDESFNANGALPGTPGVETIPLSAFGLGTNDAGVFALEIQSNGSIVVAGIADPMAAEGSSMAIARLFGLPPITPTTSALSQAILAKYGHNTVT
jgi:hypothetical protein